MFTSIAAAESFFKARGFPRHSIFRNVEPEDLAQLAAKVGDVWLYVDELDRCCNDKKWTSPTMKLLVHETAHYRVNILGTFRRAANVSEDLITQADHIFLFRHSKNATYDVQTIARRMGKVYAETVLKLEPHQCVVWSDE